MSRLSQSDLKSDRAIPLMLGLTALVGSLIVVGAEYLPPAVDWEGAFRPATLALTRLESPYEGIGFYNPPWALLFLLPFAASLEVGRAAILVLSVGVYGFVAVRMGASLITLAAFLLSPPILHTLLHGNLEWLVLLGVLAPPRWGLFLVTIKPQMGSMVALFWTVEAWREGGWKHVAGLLWPVGLAYALSVLLFGPWPLRASTQTGLWWNASLLPYSIPVGIIAIIWAIWKRDIRGALIASPCLSPYVLLHAWSGALFAFARNQRLAVLSVILLWAVALRNI
ncbi:MAG: hypothetical protein KBH93_04360 [Anaerolineae bacterium]|nr:hypothetical protein [Anaerolineae bacterium]